MITELQVVMEPDAFSTLFEQKIRHLLNIDQSILSVAIIDSHGKTLASKRKFGTSDIFETGKTVNSDDFGIWIRAMIEMIKPFDSQFGPCNAVAAFYNDTKIITIPVSSLKIFTVLVCLRSANAELLICKFQEAQVEFKLQN